MTEVKLPKLVEGVEKANLTYWYKRPGDAVAEGENLAEFVTEKASFDMPSPAGGVIRELLAQEGDEVKVGQLIAMIG